MTLEKDVGALEGRMGAVENRVQSIVDNVEAEKTKIWIQIAKRGAGAGIAGAGGTVGLIELVKYISERL